MNTTGLEARSQAEVALIRWLEEKTGFFRRGQILGAFQAEILNDPPVINTLDEEDDHDDHNDPAVRSRISLFRKIIMAAMAFPTALFAANLPALLDGSFSPHHFYPNLHPQLTAAHPDISLHVMNRRFCSVDVYDAAGILQQSYAADGHTSELNIPNFAVENLVGTDCALGTKEHLKLANLQGSTYTLDMIAWAAYLGMVAPNWSRQAMQIDQAHTLTTGSDSVMVTVVEANFDQHHLEFVRQNILALTHDGNVYQPAVGINPNELLHGTATLGMIGAEYSGVAPNAQIAFIQGYPHNESNEIGLTEENMAAIQSAVDRGSNVISISIVTQNLNYDNYKTLKPIFEQALKQGTYIAVASGNKGVEHFDSNGTLAVLAKEFPNVFLVQATTAKGTLPLFTQEGEVPAPGEDIINTVRQASESSVGTAVTPTATDAKTGEIISQRTEYHSILDEIKWGYEQYSGTSLSTPLVAGTIALAISLNPELKYQPELMERILTISARMNHGRGINAWLVVLMAMDTRLTNDDSTATKRLENFYALLPKDNELAPPTLVNGIAGTVMRKILDDILSGENVG